MLFLVLVLPKLNIGIKKQCEIFHALICMLKLCLGFLVDTLFCVKWLPRLSIFIHADILVLISDDEWWSFYLSPTTADHCGHIHTYVSDTTNFCRFYNPQNF